MTIRAHRHFETTTPSVHTCQACGRLTLYGLAEGLPVHADPVPLTALGELLALAAGRQTYTLRRSGLIHRDASRRADPRLSTPVVADHSCPKGKP